MHKYAFVVTATDGYEEPVDIFINSVKKHCPDIHVVKLTREYEFIYTSGSITSNPSGKGLIPEYPKNQLLMNYIYRMKFASELTDYDAVCLVDADMFLLRDVTKFFKITSLTKNMIAVSDCTNILYDQSYLDRYPGILKGEFYNTKTISSVPLFFCPKSHSSVLQQAYNYGIDNNMTSDLLVLNMFLCSDPEIWNNMLILPAYAWTGIHHSQLKPETRIRKIIGQYVSEAGDEIYMVHGRWFDKNWVDGLKVTMEGYFKNHFNMTNDQLPKYMEWIDDSINISLQAYKELKSGQ